MNNECCFAAQRLCTRRSVRPHLVVAKMDDTVLEKGRRMQRVILIGFGLMLLGATPALAQPPGWEGWNNNQINEWNRTHPNERLPHNIQGLPPVATQPPKQPPGDFHRPQSTALNGKSMYLGGRTPRSWVPVISLTFSTMCPILPHLP